MWHSKFTSLYRKLIGISFQFLAKKIDEKAIQEDLQEKQNKSCNLGVGIPTIK